MNAHNMFVDVSVRAVINCSLPLRHGLCILLYAITVYFLCCVASLYFTAQTLIPPNSIENDMADIVWRKTCQIELNPLKKHVFEVFAFLASLRHLVNISG